MKINVFDHPGSLLVRDYCSGDYSAISTLWDATGLGGAVRGDDRFVIERSLSLGGRLLVAEWGNVIIATSWLTYDGRRMHMHHFVVDALFRRRGIGRLLTQASIGCAREIGVQIKLEVHRENAAAISLYRSCGFEYLGDYDVYIIREP